MDPSLLIGIKNFRIFEENSQKFTSKVSAFTCHYFFDGETRTENHRKKDERQITNFFIKKLESRQNLLVEILIEKDKQKFYANFDANLLLQQKRVHGNVETGLHKKTDAEAIVREGETAIVLVPFFDDNQSQSIKKKKIKGISYVFLMLLNNFDENSKQSLVDNWCELWRRHKKSSQQYLLNQNLAHSRFFPSLSTSSATDETSTDRGEALSSFLVRQSFADTGSQFSFAANATANNTVNHQNFIGRTVSLRREQERSLSRNYSPAKRERSQKKMTRSSKSFSPREHSLDSSSHVALLGCSPKREKSVAYRELSPTQWKSPLPSRSNFVLWKPQGEDRGEDREEERREAERREQMLINEKRDLERKVEKLIEENRGYHNRILETERKISQGDSEREILMRENKKLMKKTEELNEKVETAKRECVTANARANNAIKISLEQTEETANLRRQLLNASNSRATTKKPDIDYIKNENLMLKQRLRTAKENIKKSQIGTQLLVKILGISPEFLIKKLNTTYEAAAVSLLLSNHPVGPTDGQDLNSTSHGKSFAPERTPLFSRDDVTLRKAENHSRSGRDFVENHSSARVSTDTHYVDWPASQQGDHVRNAKAVAADYDASTGAHFSTISTNFGRQSAETVSSGPMSAQASAGLLSGGPSFFGGVGPTRTTAGRGEGLFFDENGPVAIHGEKKKFDGRMSVSQGDALKSSQTIQIQKEIDVISSPEPRPTSRSSADLRGLARYSPERSFQERGLGERKIYVVPSGENLSLGLNGAEVSRVRDASKNSNFDFLVFDNLTAVARPTSPHFANGRIFYIPSPEKVQRQKNAQGENLWDHMKICCTKNNHSEDSLLALDLSEDERKISLPWTSA